MTHEEWAEADIALVTAVLRRGGVSDEVIAMALLGTAMAFGTVGIPAETFAKILEDQAAKVRADAAQRRN